MPDNAEILVSLARHEERIERNREDVRGNKEDIGGCKEAIGTIREGDERRDARIDMFQWFALLIAGAIATLAFAILRQGVLQ